MNNVSDLSAIADMPSIDKVSATDNPLDKETFSKAQKLGLSKFAY